MINDFKVWDKNKKRFISPYDVAINGEGEIFMFGRSAEADGYISEVSHIDLLEYSGRKDRNGTKLYRGDIVRVELDAVDAHSPVTFEGLPEKVIIGVVVIRPSEGAMLLVKKIIPKGAVGIAIGRTLRTDQSQDIRIGDIYTTPELIMEEVEEE